MEAQKYLPQLKGLVDSRIEREMTLFAQRLYNYYDEKLKELADNIGKTAIRETRNQLQLFSASLATPLVEASGDALGTVASDKALVVSDIPNLPMSKITGILPLTQTSVEVLLSNDGLTTTPGVFAIAGKVTIKDNDGNAVDLLYT